MKRSALFCFVTIVGVSASKGSADVIFWSDETRHPQSELSTVLRYDSDGALVQLNDRHFERDTTHNRLAQRDSDSEIEAVPPAFGRSNSQGSRMASALPMIRLTTARYADHDALALVDLNPQDWTFLFQALVRTESGFNSEAISPAGARGLAQLMPDTARGLGVDISDPRENLDGGARYLLAQIETFGALDLALAAYNAGPEAVRKYAGIPPYAETRAYVARVLTEFDRLRAEAGEGTFQ